MTTADRKAVVSLVEQLEILPGYPYGEQGRRALVAVFQDTFPSAAAVEEAIDTLFQTDGIECPSPTDVRRLARELGYRLSADERLARLADGQVCTVCDNTGVAHEERTVGYRDARNDEDQPIRVPVTINVARRCECALGKAMAQA